MPKYDADPHTRWRKPRRHAGAKTYRSQFFDSQGNITSHVLTLQDGDWTWQGESTRCTVVFSKDGKTQTAHHERSDDGVSWESSMDVTLTKVE
jgi:hypothetical protein